MTPEELYRSPNALAPSYRKFSVADRLLLTGHSHQAWPDCGFDGQARAWHDAADWVDDKWERAAEQAESVRAGFRTLLNDFDGHFALAQSTHELVVRFLSALPLAERPRLVTTDGEFHTIRRQLNRLQEEGLEVVVVAAVPTATVADRLAASVDDRTAAVLVSSVFFQTAQIAPNLGSVLDACQHRGAELLVDVYHSLNVVPFALREEHLDGAYVVGGGYKYCQLGEGNCFMRLPKDCQLRPVITGWFSEIGNLTGRHLADSSTVRPGPDRFAGATYDPTSHYRAAAVFEFFREHELTPAFLREVSQHQVRLLARGFDELDADERLITRDRSVDLSQIGGFLALQSPVAGDLYRALHDRGVLTDFRGSTLRLGPAPYLSDNQLDQAIAALADAISQLGR